MKETFKLYAQLLRTGQWYKNLLVFAPLLFASNTQAPRDLLLAFVGFCAISSITYITNDWLDRKKDRLHPIKKQRPLASGKISGQKAVTVGVVLAVITGLILLKLGTFYASILLIYLVLTTLYSFGLKNVPLLDLALITSNFLLRSSAGLNAVPQVEELPYFLFIAGLILLFLSHKRRSDNKLLGAKAFEHKPVLKFYTPKRCHGIRFLSYGILLGSLSYFDPRHWASTSLLGFSIFYLSFCLSKDPVLATKPKGLLKDKIFLLLLMALAISLLASIQVP